MEPVANQDRRRSTQTTISFLLLLTWAVGIAMVPVSRWGGPAILVSGWLLVVTVLIVRQHYQRAVFCLLPLLALGSAYFAVTARMTENGHWQCVNNLKNISLGILGYESAYGHLPPPYTTDAEGRRLHSWRVLILPFMEEEALYKQFDLNQPWDAPVNLQLADKMPEYFRCENAEHESAGNTTPFVAITGKQTVWTVDRPRKIADIQDGTDRTLLVVESAANTTHWMSPYDPAFEEVVPVEYDGSTLVLRSNHKTRKREAYCAFCDGHVDTLPTTLSWQMLREFLTIAGGEDASVQDFR